MSGAQASLTDYDDAPTTPRDQDCDSEKTWFLEREDSEQPLRKYDTREAAMEAWQDYADNGVEGHCVWSIAGDASDVDVEVILE